MILETICSVALMARLLSACAPPFNSAVGYIEGEYVEDCADRGCAHRERTSAAATSSRPEKRSRTLETADAEIAVRNAEAALAEAQAELANILYGRRPEEVAASTPTLEAAKVQTRTTSARWTARKDLTPRLRLAGRSRSAQTAFDVAASRVKELSANLAVAKLPARDEEIAAAQQGRRGAGRARQARMAA